jgi:hypothetical protein
VQKDDVIGTDATHGIYQRNSDTGELITLHEDQAIQIASGDFDADNLDDIVVWWPESIYVRYSSTGLWEYIGVPHRLLGISAGDNDGNGLDEIYLNRADGI